MRILDVSELGRVLYEWRKHSHIYWEIIVATYGNAKIISDLGDFEINMGDILIMPPEVEHYLISKNGYKDRCFYIDKLDISPAKPQLIKNEDMQFIDHSKRLIEAYKKEQEGINASFYEKSKLFLRHIMNLLSEKENSSLPTRVRNYININFADCMLSEETLAEHFEYNGNYLRRNFKKCYGLTPMQYVAFVRLSQAKNLLQFAKSYSVGEISSQCGFSDQLYFSRFFKKHTGLSPTEYRNNDCSLSKR